MRALFLGAAFAAVAIPGCSLDLDPHGEGRACSLGRCSPGYVCNAEKRCVAAAVPVDRRDGETTPEDARPSPGNGGAPGSGGEPVAAGRTGAGGASTGATGVAGARGGARASDSGGPHNTTTPMDASADAPREAGCPAPTAYYRDRDADGFGDDREGRSFCASPPPDWVRAAGDCDDADDRVFPGQTRYFGAGYAVPGGESFDYDCSGREDPDPKAAGAAPDCPALTLLVCVGAGFARTGRAGPGVDATCGSTSMITCSGLLACAATSAVVQPKECR